MNVMLVQEAIDNFNIENYDQSLDIKDFDVSFAKGLSLEDGSATITNFTAYLIVKGLEHVSQKDEIKYLICGGGRKNNYLIDVFLEHENEEKFINSNLRNSPDNFKKLIDSLLKLKKIKEGCFYS